MKSLRSIRSFAGLTFVIALLVLVVGAGNSAFAASDSWNLDATTGSWVTTSSWTLNNGTVPGSTTADSSDVATFSKTLTAADAITVDATRYIGGISFGNTTGNGYTLQTGTLHLNSGGTIQSVSADGAHTETISSPVVIDGTTTATATFGSNPTTAANGVLSFGAVTGSATASTTTALTLNGTGTGANTIAGAIANGAGGRSIHHQERGRNVGLVRKQ